MEVVTIEKEAFEEITQEINEVISLMEGLLLKFNPIRTRWLDHEEVCKVIHASFCWSSL